MTAEKRESLTKKLERARFYYEAYEEATFPSTIKKRDFFARQIKRFEERLKEA